MMRARMLDVGLVIGSVSISKISLAVFGGRQAHCHAWILTCSGGIRPAPRGVVHEQENLEMLAC
jgi:hypothetical protein